MRYCYLTLFTFVSFSLSAQHKYLPGEDDSELAKEACILCTPGVPNKSKGKGLELFYQYNSGQGLSLTKGFQDAQINTEIEFVEKFRAKLKIPIINKASFKMIMGFEYGQEVFHYGNISGAYANVFESLNGRALKTNKLSLYLTKSFDEKYYGLLRLRTSFNGDYEGLINFDNRYATYSAIGLLGIKPREDIEWGVGLTFSKNARRTNIFPFLVYNQTFNQKWGVETVLPIQVFGRYNVNRNTILLFGAEYNSKEYSVDIKNSFDDFNSPYHYKNSEINLQLVLEKKLFSWVWLNAKGGYQLPLASEFRTDLPDYSFTAKAGGNYFFSFGIFMSPPENCLKKKVKNGF